MMQFITLDFETYYSQTFSLSTMTTQEYIESTEFELIMCAVKVGSASTQLYIGVDAITAAITAIDWRKSILVAHNVQFDGAILNHVWGIVPALSVCTMSLAQSLGFAKLAGGVSLHAVTQRLRASRYTIAPKGTEVVQAKGKRLADFTAEQLAAYGSYCVTDVDICYDLARLFLSKTSTAELQFQDVIHRAMIDPVLQLNPVVLREEIIHVNIARFDTLLSIVPPEEASSSVVQQLRGVLGMLGAAVARLGWSDHLQQHADQLFARCEPVVAQALTQLNSADKFAAQLRTLGVEPPTKFSQTTGKTTFAFAKTDSELLFLLEHDDPKVGALVAARLGVKSSIALTRAETLLRLAELPSGKVRIPHWLSGAHTHRLSGKDFNIQNMPSGRVAGQSTRCRRAFVAATGDLLADPDSGQIEARVLAVLANHTDLMGIFSRGECPYSAMAEVIYATPAADIIAGDKAYKKAKSANDPVGTAQHKPMYMARQVGKATILQLGYGAGESSYLEAAHTMYGVVDMTLAEARSIVSTYRETHTPITKVFWSAAGKCLSDLCAGRSGAFGGADNQLIRYYAEDVFGTHTPVVELPDGMKLYYPLLCEVRNPFEPVDYKAAETVYCTNVRAYYAHRAKFHATHGRYPSDHEQWFKTVVDKKTGAAKLVTRGFTKRIYPGALTENITQAVAFCVLKWQGVRIDRETRVRIATNVHDAYLCVGKQDTLAADMKQVHQIMCSTPDFLPNAIFDCEYKTGTDYASV